MYDLWYWLKEYGILGSLIAAILVGFYKIFGGYLKGIQEDVGDATAKVNSLYTALSNTKGEPIVQHDLLVNMINEIKSMKEKLEAHNIGAEHHYDDIRRLTDEEQWKHCDIEKCPYISKLSQNLKDIEARFSEFEIKAEQSRNATGVSLESVNQSVQQTGKDLGKEIGDLAKMLITVLSDSLRNR